MTAQLEAAKKAAAKREAAEAATGTASIELTERYVARPADLLSCFTEAQRVMAFTQAPAQVRRLVNLPCRPCLCCSLLLAAAALRMVVCGGDGNQGSAVLGTMRNGLSACSCLRSCAVPLSMLEGCLMSSPTSLASLFEKS